MHTTYFRDHNGWNARTIIDIDGGRQLHIRIARKMYGKIGRAHV